MQHTPKKIAEIRERTLAEKRPKTSLRFPAGSLSFHTTIMGYTINAISAVMSTVVLSGTLRMEKGGKETQLIMAQSVTIGVLVLPTLRQSLNRSWCHGTVFDGHVTGPRMTQAMQKRMQVVRRPYAYFRGWPPPGNNLAVDRASAVLEPLQSQLSIHHPHKKKSNGVSTHHMMQ